ncbi:uncharacterized protein LOC125823472 [Solanum verrucosum]|uniref:uncharacterized protein LOC125823472 n=1 Tax=Solanum verrucosum TaxID=315347 RepID=UPI0020D1AE82|nr:uncharacterized protein LOC125823472 [Solanum verrucosum]
MGSLISFVGARSCLVEQIRECQFNDEKLCLIQNKVMTGEDKEASLDSNGVLRIEGRIYVPKVGEMIRPFLEEAHCTRYSIHSGAAKMYHDLSQHYWWCGMKRAIANFVLRCFTYGQSERTIQVLEDILRACVIDFGARWDRQFTLPKFAYINNYHSNILMAPFEALYSRRCKSSIGWLDSAEKDSLDTNFLRDAMEKKYMLDEFHPLFLDSVKLGPDLSFEEEPISILDRQVQKLRTKEIDSVKVQWKHHSVDEVTC